MKAGCRANPVHLERGVPTLPAGRFGPVSQDGGDDERPPAGPRKMEATHMIRVIMCTRWRRSKALKKRE
jgi:hypothetical protein